MGDARVIERIEAWEAIGLIDHETADRLRSAERAAPAAEAEASARRPSVVAAFFGPSVTVAELFAYIGGAFVLAAWHTILPGFASGGSSLGGSAPIMAFLLAQFAIPAIVLSIAGLFATGGSERQRRFAGVAFAVATWHIFQTVQLGLQPGGAVLQSGLSWDASAVVAALAAVVAALVYRRVHPAVLMQVTFLAAVAFLVSRLLQAIEDQWYWPSVGFDGDVDPLLARARVALTIVWWLGCAVVFGLVARYERRRAEAAPDLDDGAAARRAAVSAWAAGLTAIAGTAAAVVQSNGNGRALEPWLGDVAILAVAVVLLALAFRRGAGAYLYPGALGLIVAFTDLNSQYVAGKVGIGVALLVEGVILLGAGLFAERIRRRLSARGQGTAPGDGGPGVQPARDAAGAAPVAATTAPEPTAPAAAGAAMAAAAMAPAAVAPADSAGPATGPAPTVPAPTVPVDVIGGATAPAIDLDAPASADMAPGL